MNHQYHISNIILFKKNTVALFCSLAEQLLENLNSLMTKFTTRTENNIADLASNVRLMLLASVIESYWWRQSIFVNGTWRLIRNLPIPSSFDECACSVSFDCVYDIGNFFCDYGNNCTAGTIVWRLPGIKVGCGGLEGILSNDFRCFYNQTCFDIILSLYNLDMPDRLPLPEAILSIPILNSSSPSRFSPTDSLGVIFSRLMVEEWNMKSDFDSYYKTCAPSSCSYKIIERLNMVYVAVTLIGLLGGLSMFLRIFIQIIGQILILAVPEWQKQYQTTTHRSMFFTHSSIKDSY